MTKAARILFVVSMLLAEALPAQAQQSRGALINQGRDEFGGAAAAQRFLDALDPALGEPDSLWTVAGYELATALIGLNRSDLADVWIRWVVRHGGQWEIDRTYFSPAVVAAHDEARSGAVPAPESGLTPPETTWGWPAQFDADASGTISVAGEAGVAARVVVAGRADPPASGLTLPPGTYDFEISADGFESRAVTREILPGVSTNLQVDLVPLLAADAFQRAAARVVRIADAAEPQVCGNGYVATGDGLVLTSYQLVQGRAAVDVIGSDGQRFSGLSILATDPDRDLAVLRLPIAGQSLNVPGGQATEYGWAVHSVACGDAASTAVGLASWDASAASTVALFQPLVADVRGAPLVDDRGEILGLFTETTRVIPAALTRDILARVRNTAVTTDQPQRQSGGFPWVWAGAGAAAAGLAVVLLAGGGSDGPPPPPPATTGGIVVTFPN